jgi:uncharacterized protein YrrD
MLHSANQIRGATIAAVDGEIGTVEDFYYEEDQWTVRYIVVDTGSWLNSRRVLISPMSVKGPWDMHAIPVSLTRQQVQASPEIDLAGPFLRDSESHVLGHYGYPHYWGSSGVWGVFDTPAALVAYEIQPSRGDAGIDVQAPSVRSTRDVTGYHLLANDGEIGHVDDFLIDEDTWRIRYLLVDTSNWIGGKSVVISPHSLKGLNTETGTLQVDLSRDEIRQSPRFDTIEGQVGVGEVGPPLSII